MTGMYLFGSHARGDADVASDLDILLVTEESSQKTDVLSAPIDTPIRDFSFYPVDTIRDYYTSGRLFAWHLYAEAKYLSGTDYLAKLGKPNPYSEFVVDVTELLVLLGTIRDAVELPSGFQSITYDAGLLYVVIRNLAHSFSWYELEAPCFERLCPFKLQSFSGVRITKGDYLLLAEARHASTRGFRAPEIDISQLIHMIGETNEWAMRNILKLEVTNEISRAINLRKGSLERSKQVL